MDNKQQVNQPVIPSPQAPEAAASSPVSPRPKRDQTPLIIIVILLIAIGITTIAYLLIPQSIKPLKTQTQNPTISQAQIPTPTPRELAKWQTYTNKKYEYSFFYPVTWQITPSGTDQKEFELNYLDTKKPATIKVTYLTESERNAMPKTYCETTGEKNRCNRYDLTESNKALVDHIIQNDLLPATALISLHTGPEMLKIEITKTNDVSYNTFGVILDTLKFPDQPRVYPLQICPDVWPTSNKQVDYNGVKIDVADIDTTWINENCKTP
jgi:hypothetical protein